MEFIYKNSKNGLKNIEQGYCSGREKTLEQSFQQQREVTELIQNRICNQFVRLAVVPELYIMVPYLNILVGCVALLPILGGQGGLHPVLQPHTALKPQQVLTATENLPLSEIHVEPP